MEHTPQDTPNSSTPKIIEIRRILRKNNVFLADDQLAQLEKYVDRLREWNTRINLISRKDIDAIWESHILHSFTLIFKNRIPRSVSVLDLGTGGGLPGIPIAIARGDLRVTMLDATKKKTEAVQDMIDVTGLKNASVLWGRAEELSKRPGLSSSFDVVVARAVAPLDDLVRWSRPFLRGRRGLSVAEPVLLALKGGDLREEVERIERKKLSLKITVEPLVFDGSQRLTGTDKKLVSVHFDQGS